MGWKGQSELYAEDETKKDWYAMTEPTAKLQLMKRKLKESEIECREQRNLIEKKAKTKQVFESINDKKPIFVSSHFSL